MTKIVQSRLRDAGILLAMSGSLLPFSGSASLAAQTRTSATVVETTADPLTLPDAPMPVGSAQLDAPHELVASSGAQNAQQPQERQPLPQPAGPNAQKPDTAPSLEDLGMAPDQVKADPDMQARLDRRTHMLKVHQRLGLLTLAPLAAACISSAAAPPDPRHGSGNTVGRDIHLGLGSLSVGMYAATAYYAIRAPKVSDTSARGGIKLHKYLIYIHAPGMVLTPILGAMAFNQANNGEKVHGIASAHAAVAWTTVASYSAAIVAVSWPIHLKL
jgi:hypothetical protein